MCNDKEVGAFFQAGAWTFLGFLPYFVSKIIHFVERDGLAVHALEVRFINSLMDVLKVCHGGSNEVGLKSLIVLFVVLCLGLEAINKFKSKVACAVFGTKTGSKECRGKDVCNLRHRRVQKESSLYCSW